MSREGGMPDVSRRLLEALVDVYPEHVESRLVRPVTGLDAALVEGGTWLAVTLTELFSRPFREQRRGPLEVFQEAMRFPTEHLASTGLVPAERDSVATAALPGDLYDLAPASSRDLGEEVWARHLAWGAAKAADALTPQTGSAPPGGDR